MSDLRERVARAIWREEDRSVLTVYTAEKQETYGRLADTAITAVIEALAAEAEAKKAYGMGAWSTDERWKQVADWLRGHLGDTEATDEH